MASEGGTTGWLQSLFWQLVSSILMALGLSRKSATVLFLGLDNAGKTTLLYKLKDGAVKSFIPTQRAQSQEISLGGLTVKAWDLGGHEIVRELWSEYYLEADAIMFMVDSADPSRLAECKRELDSLLGDAQLAKVPVALLANKKDLANSMGYDEIVRGLDLQPHLNAQVDRPFAVFRTSVVDGTGYLDAFSWLQKVL